MRTKFPIALAVALAIAVALFNGSGMAAYFGGEAGAGGLQEQYNDSAAAANEDLDASSRSAGDLFGYVTSGAGAILDVLVMALLLPVALQDLGVPGWAAIPMGGGIQILLFFGIWQWLRGGIYR